MHLVDAHRAGGDWGGGWGIRRHCLLVRPAGEPGQVAPVIIRLEHHRGSGGRHLGVGGHRVGLLPPDAVLAAHPELVLRARAETGHEQLPDTGRAERPHRVGLPVPEIEVAGDPDPAGVRCPDGERGPGDFPPERARLTPSPRLALLPNPVVPHVGTEGPPEFLVASLADQVQVQLADRRQVPVGVILQEGWKGVWRPVGDLQPVVRYVGHALRDCRSGARRGSSEGCDGGPRRSSRSRG